MNETITYLRKHFRAMEQGEIRGEEPSSTPSLVDKRGYLSLKKQVERALQAGQRLEAYRRGEYAISDTDGFVEPSPIDQVVDPSVDIPIIASDLITKAEQVQNANSDDGAKQSQSNEQSGTSQPATEGVEPEGASK